VINMSQGFNWYEFKPFATYDSHDKLTSVDYSLLREWWKHCKFERAKYLAGEIGDFLNRTLKKGYDFVLVCAAGNDSDSSIGHLESKYASPLNLVSEEEYPEVYKRIVVVGAIDSNYEISDYSNGGERTDVYAPGDEIYSTIARNKYGYKSGTSMASPHVAGVAACVWSANNNLTGAEVKDILTSLTITYDSAVVVDAPACVLKALYSDGSGNAQGAEYGGVFCWIVNADNEEEKIQNATVTVTNVETNAAESTTTDVKGHFELILPEGEYTLKVTADGYEDYEWSGDVEVKAEGVNYLGDCIRPGIAATMERSVRSSIRTTRQWRHAISSC
jgi:subtilisin family serine protease